MRLSGWSSIAASESGRGLRSFTSRDDVFNMVKFAKDKLGRLDIAVNTVSLNFWAVK